jgi:hypothetical protein
MEDRHEYGDDDRDRHIRPGIEEMGGGRDPAPWPGDHMNRHMAASGAPVPTDPTQEA